jgi:hypothetical protein
MSSIADMSPRNSQCNSIVDYTRESCLRWRIHVRAYTTAMTAAYRNGKKRSDAMRTRGEGVPPKSATAPSLGAEREANIARPEQAKKRAGKKKRTSRQTVDRTR